MSRARTIPRVLGAGLLAAGVLAAACGRDFPSRDWSGSYLTRMAGSSSDCRETPLPPPLSDLILELRQRPDNSATVQINPVIALAGTFEGDRLEAKRSLVDSLTLPDTLTARLTPADSFDTVVYAFRAEFERWRFRGDYEIRAPDVRALVKGVRPVRCTFRYQVVGVRFEPPPLSEQPWMRGLERDTAAGPDTAAGADTARAGAAAGAAAGARRGPAGSP